MRWQAKRLTASVVILASVLAATATAGGAVAAVAAVEPDAFRFADTRALFRLCSADESDVLFSEARHACYGFMYGVGLFYKQAIESGHMRAVVCPGGELTRERMREVFVAWALAHPEHLHESPVDGLLRAAAAAWPCAQEPRP